MPGKKVETLSAALWAAVGNVSNMLTWTVLADILQEQNKTAKLLDMIGEFIHKD